MRSIRFLQFYNFFSLDLVIHPDDGFTASSHQFSSIVVVIQRVELFVNGSRVVFDGGEQFSRVQVPVLNLTLGVSSSENVSRFEIVVFGSPEDI